MRLGELKKLIKTVEESDIEELEIKGIFRTVRIAKKKGVAVVVPEEKVKQNKVTEETKIIPPEQEPPQKTTSTPPQTTIGSKNLAAIKAPMVGTFYRASSPDAAPYVEIGDKISKGKIVCIIEAMKVMNEIESDFSGTVREILVENAKPVEYGQPLFMIEC